MIAAMQSVDNFWSTHIIGGENAAAKTDILTLKKAPPKFRNYCSFIVIVSRCVSCWFGGRGIVASSNFWLFIYIYLYPTVYAERE